MAMRRKEVWKTGISERTETTDTEKKRRVRDGNGGTIKVFST